MDVNEIVNLAISALGGGGIASLVNWRLHKRKEVAETKQEEIEAIRKMVEDAYKPTIEHLEGQVAKLYDRQKFLEQRIDTLTAERDDCKQQLAEMLTKLDGIAAERPTRNPRTGRYVRRTKGDEANC